jgi:hypothetical protein
MTLSTLRREGRCFVASTATTKVRGVFAPDPFGRPGWFVGPGVDIWFVPGLGALLSVCLFVASKDKSVFIVCAVLFEVLSDYPHVLQTTARVWLDPRERSRYGAHYAISLVVTAALVAGLLYSHEILILASIWAYWQVLHVLKQHYGILSIYAAKHKYRASKRAAKYALFSGCLAPVIFRAAHGFQFTNYVVFGYRLPFSDLKVPTPPIPWLVVVAGYAFFAVALAVFVRQQWRLRRSSTPGERPLPAMALATMISAVVSYNLSYLLVSDLFALILIATTTHSLQYHVISWTRNNSRFGAQQDLAQQDLGSDQEAGQPGESARPRAAGQRPPLLARLSRRRALPAYIAFFAVLGIITGRIDMVLLGVIPLSLVLHHFYLDGVVWKNKTNPELAYELGIVRPATRG